MKQQSWKFLVTFHNTVGAMEMEAYCMEHGLPGRLIPVPREISAGCGMAWCADMDRQDALKEVLDILKEQVEDTYRLLL